MPFGFGYPLGYMAGPGRGYPMAGPGGYGFADPFASFPHVSRWWFLFSFASASLLACARLRFVSMMWVFSVGSALVLIETVFVCVSCTSMLIPAHHVVPASQGVYCR